MKNYRKELLFVIPERTGVIKITDKVNECLKTSEIQEGLCLVNAMNVTASVFINDDSEELKNKFAKWLDRIAPRDPGKKDDDSDTDTLYADTHLKRTVMGRETVIAVTKGKLDLGTWENIMYYEFDGRRKKRVLVKIIGE